MIVSDNFLKKLRNIFDLNIYEVKIWTALLSKGISSAGELSDISNVPRSRAYDVLESLEKKGFAIMKLGKPIKYIAVAPEEIIKRVKRNVKVLADEKLKNLEVVKDTDTFTELELLHKQGIEHLTPESLSGALKGRDNIYSYLENMVGNAKKSLVLVTSQEGFLREMELLQPLFSKLKNGGVKIRIGAPFTDNEEVKALVKDVKNFADVRNLTEIKGRFVIVDGKDVLFMTHDDKEVHENYDLGIWANTPFFASAMENMLNHVWNKLEKV